MMRTVNSFNMSTVLSKITIRPKQLFANKFPSGSFKTSNSVVMHPVITRHSIQIHINRLLMMDKAEISPFINHNSGDVIINGAREVAIVWCASFGI